jgi:hypothetical protein
VQACIRLRDAGLTGSWEAQPGSCQWQFTEACVAWGEAWVGLEDGGSVQDGEVGWVGGEGRGGGGAWGA